MDCVKIGNAIAARWAVGAIIAVVRRVLWAAEQPSSSVLPMIPCVKYLMQLNAYGYGYPGGMLVRLHLPCSMPRAPSYLNNGNWVLHTLYIYIYIVIAQ